MDKTDKPITVYSCGTDFSVDSRLSRYIAEADRIYASKKLLQKLPPNRAAVHAFGTNARGQASEILQAARHSEKILILASGDSLYNGFGGTIAEAAKEQKLSHLLDFIPNVTAFQSLFSRLGMAWQDAEFFSVHFKEELPLRKIVSTRLAVIYCGTKYTADSLAKKICGFSPSQKTRPAVSAQELGTEQEKILQAKLEEICLEPSSPTSILVLLPLENGNDADNQITLGISDAFYEKENNLITQQDCRAIILSRLRLPKEGVFWDLGAGSGAVGLEAAGLTDMQVYAVEKNRARLEHIESNRKKLGIANYSLIEGGISEKIPDLPKAVRVFVGGGGKDITEILDKCKQHTEKNALILASCVTLETYHRLYAYENMERIDLLEISVSSEQRIAKNYHCFQQNHKIYLFIFKN